MPNNIIVAPQPLAVEAGADVLANGGNAIDAAVAAALVQHITDPQMNGLGGYALLTLKLANQSAQGLDAPALAGAETSPDMWTERVIGPNPDGWGFFLEGNVNEIGYSSICTPGTVKMLDTMLNRWGTMDWGTLAEAAVILATDGYAVNERLANRWVREAPQPHVVSLLGTIEQNPEARRIYLKADGSPYATGDVIRNQDYARTLERIAQRGASDFYSGELARQMAQDLAANGSFVTEADLANYQLRMDTHVNGTFRTPAAEYDLISAGPPHGGATLIAILNIVEGWDLQGMGHNSADYIYKVSMAMKAAFADRNRHMADPDFVDVPTAWMMSKERADFWRDRIDRGEAIDPSYGSAESPHTTQMTVVDAAGNCVSLTHSLGSSSGVITPNLGFMYNNSMINFYPLPGHPNSIEPGKGRTTGMAPTIVSKDGAPLLVLGAPGATRIITSIAQVILNVTVFDMAVDRAVHAPRFDCQIGAIRCQRRIPTQTLEQIRRQHPAVHLPFSHGGLALIHAIHIDPETGARTAAADTGADGMAMHV